MTIITALATSDQISSIVQSLLTKRSINTTLNKTDDVRTLGLTSLDMVNLMLAVEDQFGIEIPPPAMTPENFQSIAAIENLVQSVGLAA